MEDAIFVRRKQKEEGIARSRAQREGQEKMRKEQEKQRAEADKR